MNSQERKQHPMYEALFRYFPEALMAVSNHSWKANEKHNPGQPVHWNRELSTDELDALLRHVIDKAKGEDFCSDGLRHSTSIAWRALANLQKELERERNSMEFGTEYHPKDVADEEMEPEKIEAFEQFRKNVIGFAERRLQNLNDECLDGYPMEDGCPCRDCK